MKEYIVRENIADAIEKSIYADRIQELIRCKDCKHYKLFPNGCNGQCTIAIDAFNVFYPDDYCSFSERREE